MLGPSVGGQRRNEVLPLALLLVGTTSGGLLLGAGLLSIGKLLGYLEAAKLGIVIAFSTLAGVAVIVPRVKDWLPERSCQVRRSMILAHGLRGAALRWGLELGVGVSTFMVTPGLLAVLAVAIAQSRSIATIIVCTAYGAARGATIVTFSMLPAARRNEGGRRGLPESGLVRLFRIPLLIAIVFATILSLYSPT